MVENYHINVSLKIPPIKNRVEQAGLDSSTNETYYYSVQFSRHDSGAG